MPAPINAAVFALLPGKLIVFGCFVVCLVVLVVLVELQDVALGPVARRAEGNERPSCAHPVAEAVGPVVAELMSKARLNASMAGTDHEGPGFPSQSI